MSGRELVDEGGKNKRIYYYIIIKLKLIRLPRYFEYVLSLSDIEKKFGQGVFHEWKKGNFLN